MIAVHGTRLLSAALYADKYFVVQIKDTVGRLNLLESQLAIAELAVRRGRRLDECTHMVARDASERGMERSKGSQLKGWIESPNALRWRLDRHYAAPLPR